MLPKFYTSLCVLIRITFSAIERDFFGLLCIAYFLMRSSLSTRFFISFLLEKIYRKGTKVQLELRIHLLQVETLFSR